MIYWAFQTARLVGFCAHFLNCKAWTWTLRATFSAFFLTIHLIKFCLLQRFTVLNDLSKQLSENAWKYKNRRVIDQKIPVQIRIVVFRLGSDLLCRYTLDQHRFEWWIALHGEFNTSNLSQDVFDKLKICIASDGLVEQKAEIQFVCSNCKLSFIYDYLRGPCYQNIETLGFKYKWDLS